MMVHRTHRIGADVLLLLTSFFWGLTFVIVKEAISRVGVFLFLSQRFLLAFAILLALSFAARRSFSLRTLRQGVVLGALLFGAFALQTMALRYTTASNTAFLTGLNVVFVPIVGSLLFRQHVTWSMKTGVVIAAMGMYFLCTNGDGHFGRGEVLAFFCALSVAGHVVMTGEYARSSDVYWLTTVQIGTVAFLSTSVAGIQREAVFSWYPEILPALIICVIFATIFAFLVQTSMQRYTSPTHTAIIFCMEPVFGALCAHIMLGEAFGSRGYAGAALIVAGMILSEISSIAGVPSTEDRVEEEPKGVVMKG